MSRKILIVGAGGHAKVVIEIARACGFDVACCTDVDTSPREVFGVPVIGGDEKIASLFDAGIGAAIVALGNNALRVRLSQRLLEIGYDLPCLVSPTAVLSPSVSVGMGTVVMPGAVVNADTSIGDFVILNTKASVDHDCFLGEGVHIAPGATVTGSIHLGNNVFIGAGATLLPNVRIGSNAVVGAGAVVNRDVPADAKVVGVPARPLFG